MAAQNTEIARKEGRARQLTKLVETLLPKGMTLAEIADLLELPKSQPRAVAAKQANAKK